MGWPWKRGMRVGFEQDGIIVTGVLKEWEQDKQTGVVEMTFE